MKGRAILSLSYFAFPLLFAQAPVNGDGNWPREIDTDNIHLAVYQPQVDNWKDNRIEARSAVIVTRKGDPTQIFGIVSINARTEVDRESRLVAFNDITIKDATFPSAPALQSTLLKAVRESVPSWPQTVSLDRLLADLEISQAETKAESIRLKNDPPKVILSQSPAVLILIDGEPAYRPVEGTRYTRVVNTPALMLFDSSAGIFYLDGGPWWMTASSLKGPWTAAPNPPQDLDDIRKQFTRDEDKEPVSQTAKSSAPNPPAVYVSTVPAELLVTRGEPTYAPIPKTSLLYITNSDYDIFMDTKTQQYYTLIAGRWFRAKSIEGSWEWVAGEQLPHEFARISPDSAKGHVLASIPGTEQAREAVIANQIPQTATVRRGEAKAEVLYDGSPQFRPIEGTSMEYAINTSSEVIHAEGRYYLVQHGVWFVADSPLGPWIVADWIPPVIYTIPPSLRCTTSVTCTSMAPHPSMCTRAILPAIWERSCPTEWWCLAPDGGIRVCSAETSGAVGPGPGDSDSSSATGGEAGSGGRWAITGGITPRLSRIGFSPNTGTRIGALRIRLGFMET